MTNSFHHSTATGSAGASANGRHHVPGFGGLGLRVVWLGLVLGFTAVMFSGPVMAQSGQGAGRDACKADIERFCPSVQRGEDRVRKCLSDNKSQLSDQCKRALDRAGDRHRRGDSKN
ncbi:MAG: cysteine rich repeat-containing protein [Roseomonas sp.]|nr:cysteine rich repeat-containing protein [Roseomonas sp.]MCA3330753.1 cysteine rich repeat-containing protein [Roseomonas sp.]MCA3334242.1 cysteine rich repeat-containing protein [Roseomonas sp.]MCA3347389.1 cysteine rich repeat-containing protein [Roseomonas sp.]MCA3372727.1 cysteine rich repeat-containing protein [Roseomonas sp.]